MVVDNLTFNISQYNVSTYIFEQELNKLLKENWDELSKNNFNNILCQEFDESIVKKRINQVHKTNFWAKLVMPVNLNSSLGLKHYKILSEAQGIITFGPRVNLGDKIQENLTPFIFPEKPEKTKCDLLINEFLLAESKRRADDLFTLGRIKRTTTEKEAQMLISAFDCYMEYKTKLMYFRNYIKPVLDNERSFQYIYSRIVWEDFSKKFTSWNGYNYPLKCDVYFKGNFLTPSYFDSAIYNLVTEISNRCCPFKIESDTIIPIKSEPILRKDKPFNVSNLLNMESLSKPNFGPSYLNLSFSVPTNYFPIELFKRNIDLRYITIPLIEERGPLQMRYTFEGILKNLIALWCKWKIYPMVRTFVRGR